MAGDLTQAEHNIDKVHAVVHGADGRQGFSTLITGTASINSDFSQTANKDLQKGEAIGVPIALIILLLVFGALVAAMLPIFLALVAITFAVALTALVGQTFAMSVFAINIISMMGLATGIDYSLFIVSRFREERAKGRDKIDAISVTGGTATRAVVFSGMTVVLALCGLLIVPTNIFVSLAVGAILVVSMSVLAAVTLLPAVLGILGDGVNRLRVPYLGRRLLQARAEGRVSWLARVAQRAMRRPALTLVVGVAVLLALAAPALTMKTGVSGVNTFPNSFQSKQAFGILERQFSAGGVSPVQIVIDKPASSRRRADGRGPAHGGAGARPRLRPRAAPGLEDRRPDPHLGAGQRRGAERPGPAHGAGPARHRDPAGLRRHRRQRLRHGAGRGQRRLHRHRQQPLPLGRRLGAGPQLRAAAGRLPQHRHPGQGHRDEPAERGRRLRPHHPRVAARRGRTACSASSTWRSSNSGCRCSCSASSSVCPWTTRCSC